jgi:choline dehydrogenase-like flavoprotein
MERIPQSYSDQVVSEKVRNLSVEIYGKKYPVWVASLAQARNSIPRKGYTPIGAPGAPEVGLRCEGNANCIPICPVHAKYTALKTIGRLDAKHTTLVTQAVATRVLLDGNGRVSGIEYKRYQDESSPVCETLTAKGTIYILAAHAIETAKLLLASGAANSSDQVGRNLMDHPWFYTWALAPMDLGMFRGPAMTSGIPSFRDGPFRTEFAAFRIDVGNWAWDVATFPPDSNVNELAAKNVFGAKLRKKLGDTIPRQLRLGMVTEQLPDPGNRVTISPEYTDAIGAYRPVLHYNIADYTRLSFVNAIRISNAIYRAMGIGPDDIKTHFSNASPMYMTYRMPNGKVIDLSCIGSGHHMGTHRMGVSRTDSVVNRYQRSWDHENLFLVGCGSMPTSGSSNPTITAAAMALMATDEMLRDLR